MPPSLPEYPEMKEKCRLQVEEDDQSVLLYPEGVVKLNQTGYAILKLMDGSRSVNDIVAELEDRYDQSNLEADVRNFLRGIYEEGLIVDARD